MRRYGTRGLFAPGRELTEMLRHAVNQFMNRTGRPPSLIVLHKSAPFLGDEIEAIHDIASNYRIKYALVHIERNNPYRRFDREQRLDWNNTEIEVREPITIKYAREAAKLKQHATDLQLERIDVRDLI